ncbi:MAG: DUF2807 domain-containing protein [Maricaulaceae bacterium]
MRTLYILTSAAILACSATIATADDTSSKTYSLDGFTGVKASAGISVTFQQAQDYSVVATFKDADERDVKIRMEGDVLKISYRNGVGENKRRRRVEVAVTGPKLELARATSGAALQADNLTVGDIKLKSDSGGSLSISGTCNAAAGKVSSGGSVNAKGLKCKFVEAKASSGGSFSGHASDYGKGHASSGGAIAIYGEPSTQKKNKSWSGGAVSFP